VRTNWQEVEAKRAKGEIQLVTTQEDTTGILRGKHAVEGTDEESNGEEVADANGLHH